MGEVKTGLYLGGVGSGRDPAGKVGIVVASGVAVGTGRVTRYQRLMSVLCVLLFVGVAGSCFVNWV